jgi:hypothetical protein
MSSTIMNRELTRFSLQEEPRFPKRLQNEKWTQHRSGADDR